MKIKTILILILVVGGCSYFYFDGPKRTKKLLSPQVFWAEEVEKYEKQIKTTNQILEYQKIELLKFQRNMDLCLMQSATMNISPDQAMQEYTAELKHHEQIYLFTEKRLNKTKEALLNAKKELRNASMELDPNVQ